MCQRRVVWRSGIGLSRKEIRVGQRVTSPSILGSTSGVCLPEIHIGANSIIGLFLWAVPYFAHINPQPKPTFCQLALQTCHSLSNAGNLMSGTKKCIMLGCARLVFMEEDWASLAEAMVGTSSLKTRISVPFTLSVFNKVTPLSGTVDVDKEGLLFKDSANVLFATCNIPGMHSTPDDVSRPCATEETRVPLYVEGQRFVEVFHAVIRATGITLPIAQAWKTFQLVCEGRTPFDFFACLYVCFFESGVDCHAWDYETCIVCPEFSMIPQPKKGDPIENPSDPRWLQSVVERLIKEAEKGFSESPPTVPRRAVSILALKAKKRP